MKEIVFITGANGFIGSHLCEYFYREGYNVYGLVRRTSDLRFLKDAKVNLIYGDLKKADEIDFPSNIKYFVHNASIVSDTANHKRCEEGIFNLTQNLLKAIKIKSIDRFIYISSVLTLGYGRENISQKNPGLPADTIPYAFFKKKTEVFLQNLHQNDQLKLVIIRPGDVYGPRDRTSCMQMLDTAKRGVPLIVGNGLSKFPICYVDNLCQAVYKACIKDGVLGKAYTVTNGQGITWREFFTQMMAGIGKKQRIYVPVFPVYLIALAMELILKIFPDFNITINRYRLKRITTHTTYDISDTLKDLDYKPDTNSVQQIENIIQWYLNDKKEFKKN